MTLMALLFTCFNRIFSGLRSQWMIRCRRRNESDFKSCTANRRISPSETPWDVGRGGGACQRRGMAVTWQ